MGVRLRTKCVRFGIHRVRGYRDIFADIYTNTPPMGGVFVVLGVYCNRSFLTTGAFNSSAVMKTV